MTFTLWDINVHLQTNVSIAHWANAYSGPTKQKLMGFHMEKKENRAYVSYVALNSSEYYNQVLPGESIRRKVISFDG